MPEAVSNAPALVVVNGRVELVPLSQLMVAVPEVVPLAQLADPLPAAEIVPLLIPVTPWQLLRLPENV